MTTPPNPQMSGSVKNRAARSTGRRFDRGTRSASQSADTARMIWPVAALAVFLLGFVIVYGSRLQTRLETLTAPAQGDSGVDTDIL